MSSAVNHRKRSHRSSTKMQSTFGNIQSKAAYRDVRTVQAKSMRQNLAEAFSRLHKQKESKADKQ